MFEDGGDIYLVEEVVDIEGPEEAIGRRKFTDHQNALIATAYEKYFTNLRQSETSANKNAKKHSIWTEVYAEVNLALPTPFKSVEHVRKKINAHRVGQ